MAFQKKETNRQLKDYLQLSKSLLAKPMPRAEKAIGVTMALGVLGALQSVDAAVVYSGPQNVSCNLAGNSNRCYANIDMAGGNDFEIHRNHALGNVFIQVDEVPGGGFAIDGFRAQVVGGYVYPYPNLAGQMIGPAGPWGFHIGQANSLQEQNSAYPNDKWNLAAGTTRFLGIRSSAPVRYGWIRITVNGFGNFTLVDWAYENIPNQPISAGITSAAGVSIGGRVLTSDGRGLGNAVVTLTRSGGGVLTARTSPFGYYRIEGITAGEAVTITVDRKGYRFQPRVMNVGDDLSDIDFTPTESKD